MLKFTIFDIILFSMVGVSTLLGAYKGAIKITLGLLVFLASILAVVLLFPFVGNYFGQYISNKLVLNTLTIFLSFLLAMVVFSLIGSKIGQAIKNPGLMDNVLGLVLGAIRGILLSLALFGLMIIAFSAKYKDVKNAHDIINNVDKSKYPSWLLESFSFNYLENAYKNILAILPEDKLKNLTVPEQNKDNFVLPAPEQNKPTDMEQNKGEVLPMTNQPDISTETDL